MPLDEFKTQVLLLHSEQSALDDLRAGFSDGYTVHCATSGSEALNTLVETPINIIISAHDLPGMSGFEALREAKKRSPDTIGILLAGKETSDIEALVGDEEVFQVVSGNVTGDGLLQLVESATHQMRLIALAESANDTTADVDLPAEHIIMETASNGSTIISDGTGRIPALDPEKVSAAANLGSKAIDILILTKDQEFLETIRESSRGMHKVVSVKTLEQASDAIGNNKIGVAIVDSALAGEKVEQLTQYLRKGSPRLVSIVAGRRDDGEMLMDLINRGKVYRFLLKPVSPGRARLAIESSVKHHLEAPDTAFISGTKVSTPPPATTASKPAHDPKAQATTAANITSLPSMLNSGSHQAGSSPGKDRLADAFDGDDSSFSATVTGMISSVGKRFSSDTSEDDAEAAQLGIDTPAAHTDSNEPQLDELASRGSIFRGAKLMGFGAAAAVIAAGALYWQMNSTSEIDSQPEQTLATPSITEADVVLEEIALEPEVSDASVASRTIDAARLARDVGQIYSPASDNAIELYAQVMANEPDNAVVAEELAAVIEQALGLAESAILEARLDDAGMALQRVAANDPQNSRLPFLSAQLSQIRLRERLDMARTAIREQRFEDAASELSIAYELTTSDMSEIDAVVTELATARSQQQTDGVLSKAANRLDAGNLLDPPNDNARYYYELVLSNDNGNTAAQQGLNSVAAKLAFQARTLIASGDLNAADRLLVTAKALNPGNAEVASTLTELSHARDIVAEQRRRAEAEERDAAERRATAEHEAAEKLLADAAALTAAEGGNPESSAITSETGNTDLQSARATGLGTALNGAAASEHQATKTTPIQQIASMSSLVRTKYVAPRYPRSAQRRNVSGWVDIIFTVVRDGTVMDVAVRDSRPGEVFVASAVKAIEEWEFEPVIENGIAVDKRAGVRMMFELE